MSEFTLPIKGRNLITLVEGIHNKFVVGEKVGIQGDFLQNLRYIVKESEHFNVTKKVGNERLIYTHRQIEKMFVNDPYFAGDLFYKEFPDFKKMTNYPVTGVIKGVKRIYLKENDPGVYSPRIDLANVHISFGNLEIEIFVPAIHLYKISKSSS